MIMQMLQKYLAFTSLRIGYIKQKHTADVVNSPKQKASGMNSP